MQLSPKTILARLTILNFFVVLSVIILCLFALHKSIETLSTHHLLKTSQLLIQQYLEYDGQHIQEFYPGVQIVDKKKLPLAELVHYQDSDATWFEYSQHGRHFWGHSIPHSESEFLVIDMNLQRNWSIEPLMTTESFIVLGSIVLITASFLIFLLSRYLLSPLHKLASTIGQADVNQIPVGFSAQYQNDECGTLARIFESKIERIKKFINREQQFTRDASHELRTSVTVIKNVSEELLNSTKLDTCSKKQVKRISNANFEAENTIKTLLLLAREDYEPQQRHIVNVAEVIENTVIQNAYLLDGKIVEVDVDVTPNAKIAIQPGAFAILVSNLISNAFQYTQQGEVSIVFRNNVLVVSDTGPGIPPELINQINKPFIKGHNSKGFGIGLSIVKRLCETYFMRMRINQKKQQQGTIISVFFD